MAGLKCLVGDALLYQGKAPMADPPKFGGKKVGLYFSAHWCPPCRKFTPELIKWYNKMKESPKGDTMDIIFISSDRDEAAFEEYYSEMPWYALPFSDRDRKASLSKKFKVSGIPTLVVLDADSGVVITTKGRELVGQDPDGFPWQPKALSDILTSVKCEQVVSPVLSKAGDIEDIREALQGKITAYYFSAHWCPPCRGFTPELLNSYAKLKKNGKDFEVVFVSWDRSQDEFNEYYDTMPWLALPFGDHRIKELNSHFDIEGIPSLIVVDKDNEIITKNGRAAVSGDPEGKEFPWHPKPLNMLTSSQAGALNDTTSIIYFAGEDVAKCEEAADMMRPVAERYAAQCKADRSLPEVAFFSECEDSEDLPEQIRNFARLGKDCPLLVVLDIPNQLKYIHKSGEITAEEVENIVSKIRASTLDMVALRNK